MREAKEYRVYLSKAEIVAALKRAYPESLTIQAMPHRDGLVIEILPEGVCFRWVRNEDLR